MDEPFSKKIFFSFLQFLFDGKWRVELNILQVISKAFKQKLEWVDSFYYYQESVNEAGAA